MQVIPFNTAACCPGFMSHKLARCDYTFRDYETTALLHEAGEEYEKIDNMNILGIKTIVTRPSIK